MPNPSFPPQLPAAPTLSQKSRLVEATRLSLPRCRAAVTCVVEPMGLGLSWVNWRGRVGLARWRDLVEVHSGVYSAASWYRVDLCRISQGYAGDGSPTEFNRSRRAFFGTGEGASLTAATEAAVVNLDTAIESDTWSALLKPAPHLDADVVPLLP